jgi:hypothetical protein
VQFFWADLTKEMLETEKGRSLISQKDRRLEMLEGITMQ